MIKNEYVSDHTHLYLGVGHPVAMQRRETSLMTFLLPTLNTVWFGWRRNIGPIS